MSKIYFKMCHIDEGFTKREIFDETGWCKNCKMKCEFAGRE